VSLVATVQAKKRLPILQIVKTIGAGVIAWYIAEFTLGDPKPVFATIAALIVVQPSVNQSLGRALERSVGAVLGVAIAFGMVLIFGDYGWVALLAMSLGIVMAWMFKLTPATAVQIALSAMLVLAVGAITPVYALDRVIETVIGAIVGIAINAFVAPPVAITPANEAVSRLGADVAHILEDMGSVLSRPTSYEVLNSMYWDARGLREELNSTTATLTRAQESLRFNARKKELALLLQREQQLINRLAILVTRVIGMARAIRDNYDDSILDEPTIHEISDELLKAGHDLRLVVRDLGLPAVAAPHPDTSELPALTKPIVVSSPSGANWILIGFMMENIRLVRGEITGATED
jgi:uncharacterized membrane protein YgaE (UPF0421/DUF939 family)